VNLRHLRLEIDDPAGAPRRVLDARELEDGLDVCAVLRARLDHGGGGGHVVLAVRHAEPALHEVGHALRRRVEIGCHPKTEEPRGLVAGAVHRIHVGSQLLAEVGGQIGLRLEGGDARERRLQRGEAFRLGRGLVHRRGVEIAHLPLQRSGRCVRAGRGLEDLPRLEAEPLLELSGHTPGATVGRDLGGREPPSVGVAEEVVARADRAVDGRRIEPGHRGRATSARIRSGSGGAGEDESEGKEVRPKGHPAGLVGPGNRSQEDQGAVPIST